VFLLVRKGIDLERKLVNMLWEEGYAAIRIPASGAGSSRYPKPDIICGDGKRYLAFQVKSTKNEMLYIDHNDIDALKDFSKIFGAKPYLAIKFSNDTSIYFLEPEDLPRTRSENYKISQELAKQKGLTFEMLMKNCVKITLDWD